MQEVNLNVDLSAASAAEEWVIASSILIHMQQSLFLPCLRCKIMAIVSVTVGMKLCSVFSRDNILQYLSVEILSFYNVSYWQIHVADYSIGVALLL